MKTNSISSSVKLTEFSHGAGCGCKISPNLLKEILGTNNSRFIDPNLLVGNESSDDAAVFDLGDGRGLISTTDFFMPIVDDPFDFGMIAGSNALSDVYAMGGKPLMAIAIFGWPINKLSADIGARVIEGGREICSRAGITLAGGHSIDSPEPIFGLSVSGIVDIDELKKNTSAQVGDTIFLTKPLGIGVLSTAQKKKVVSNADHIMAVKQMCSLNDIGSKLAKISGVNAVTDVILIKDAFQEVLRETLIVMVNLFVNFLI
jgi:selenide,water dikinase